MAPPSRRKKGAVTKKARPTAPKKPNQKNQGFPYLAVIVALCLCAFIGYFIFAVEKPDPVVVEVEQKPTLKKEEVLPEKPQPKWQYEEFLPSKEVKVDIPEEIKNTRPYQMQCGSFKKQDDAESLKAKIAFQGLKSIVKKTGTWYRVILGPYDRKRLAEKDRHKLQRARINGCQIWYWR